VAIETSTIETAAPAILTALLGFGIVILALLYVYNSLVWQTIARKLKHPYPWLAWIPFANISLILQLGEFHWAWVFLILIPILGWIALGVLMIISCWRIFEKRGYPAWLSLIPILGVIPFIGSVTGMAFLIILGFVAWRD
jgi:hypothetical protein